MRQNAWWFTPAIAGMFIASFATGQDAARTEVYSEAPAAAATSPDAAPGPGANAAAPNANRKKAKSGEGAPNDPAAAGKANPSADSNAPKPVMRPVEPANPPDPSELAVRPDSDGLVAFSFKGQPWPAVLEWLADISNMSLEWQEAPPGYLDLTTRGKHTVADVTDRVNFVLLSRGYTLLRHGDILTVAKLDKLDSSLVPRVTADELADRGTFELVKVFFDLDSLLADQMAEEIKPMLSAHGKVTPLKGTNRLDILETAGNLRRIHELLDDEQSSTSHNRLIQEFPLRYIQASDAQATLKTLLGIEDKPASPAAMSPDMMRQQQQMMMEQQQQAMRNGKAPAPAGSEEAGKVYIAVNVRENSLLVHAPADKMAVVSQALHLLDVPPSRDHSLLTNMSRMQIYRLVGIDPEPLVKVLRDLGELDPTTRLEVDTGNRAIVAFAPLADHVKISALVEKLDGSGRTNHVLELRRLDAEYVAGSLEYLMKGPPKENNSSDRYSYYYGYYGRGGQQEDGDKDEFRVEADIEFNRLLLHANEVEMAEVNELLVKLGELPRQGQVGSPVRVIDVAPGEEMDRLIERLEKLWPSVGPNRLDIESSGGPEPRQNDAPPLEPASTTRSPFRIPAMRLTPTIPVEQGDADDAETRVLMVDDTPSSERGELAALPEATEGTEDSARIAPPVSILRTPEGIIISSQDPRALDLMEELAADLRSTRASYKVFPLQNTYADDVALLLEDVFLSDEGSKSNDDFDSWFYGSRRSSNSDERASRLSRRRPLKFVPDPVTNTILVQNADDEQLKEIGSLVALYDRAEPPDSKSVRVNKVIPLRYAMATEVRDILKELLRDLLSPNDKDMQQANQQQQQREEERRPTYTYVFGGGGESDDQALPKFKGLLSVAVDTRSNSLLVSAPQYLLTIVEDIAQDLDAKAEATRPVVRVLQVEGNFNDFRGALSRFAAESAASAVPKEEVGIPRGEFPPEGRFRGNGPGMNGQRGE